MWGLISDAAGEIPALLRTWNKVGVSNPCYCQFLAGWRVSNVEFSVWTVGSSGVSLTGRAVWRFSPCVKDTSHTSLTLTTKPLQSVYFHFLRHPIRVIMVYSAKKSNSIISSACLHAVFSDVKDVSGNHWPILDAAAVWLFSRSSVLAIFAKNCLKYIVPSFDCRYCSVYLCWCLIYFFQISQQTHWQAVPSGGFTSVSTMGGLHD
jgi:hypothetical protein